MFNDATIPLAKIAEMDFSRKCIKLDEQTRILLGLGEIDSYNVILHLKNEHTMYGLYGFTKNFTTIAFYVDDKEGFETKLKLAIDILQLAKIS